MPGVTHPFRSLLHSHEYLDYRLPAMSPPNDVNAFHNRILNLSSLLRLTMGEYVRTNIQPSRHTVYSLRRPIEFIPFTYPRVPLVHRLRYYNIFAM